jgi:hypothetical protein
MRQFNFGSGSTTLVKGKYSKAMSYIDGVHQIVIVIAEIPAVVLTIHHLSVVILIVLSLLQQQQHDVMQQLLSSPFTI